MRTNQPLGGTTRHASTTLGLDQLNAIFNYAERYYGLTDSPVRRVDKIGSKKGGEMQFWTKDEYLRFSEAVMDKPLSFHAFELLYWTGIRCGELPALTPSDFMLETSRLRINKSCQSLHGVDAVTDPKTPKSVRTTVMPAFLRDEMATSSRCATTSPPTSACSP